MAIQPNESISKWQSIFKASPNHKDEITIEGIPFQMLGKEPMAQATPMKESGEIKFKINGKPGAIYLFMGAHYDGKNLQSNTGEALTTVTNVERFVTRVEYADGVNDLIFPSRFPDGAHEIGQEPAVYKIRPTRRAVIRCLTLMDRMNCGRFFVMGVTAGPDIPDASETRNEPKNAKATPELTKWNSPLPKEAVASSALGLMLDPSGRQAVLLLNRSTRVNWIKAATPLYEVKADGKVEAQMKTRTLPGGGIELTLEVRNSSDKVVKVNPTFPMLRGLTAGGDPQQLAYCFPRLGAAISNLPTSLTAVYGARFPVQFIDVYYPGAGGIYLMTHDIESGGKTFWIKKDSVADMGVNYLERTMQPGERWVLPPAVIGAHQGDWHEALYAYRQWKDTWYKPAVPRKQWFREVFNFDHKFLTDLKTSGGINSTGMYNPKTQKYSILETLKKDAEWLGGVDYLHIYDWYAGGEQLEHGLGDYEPYAYFGGADRLKSEIAKVKHAGIPVGLYIQGVFIDKRGEKMGRAHGKEWQMIKADMKPYVFPWEHLLAMCAAVPGWRDFSAKTYEQVNGLLDPSALYMDSLGWGDWLCYAPNHDHPVPYPRVKAEEGLMRRIRAAVPPDKPTYAEELAGDVASQYADGTFTYATLQADPKLSPSRINLFRFMFPDYKIFEILWNDPRQGDDIHLMKQIFFCGEGIMITGDIPTTFRAEMAAEAKHSHQILREHRDAFTSLNPEPLVPTLNDKVYANRFPGKGKTVWTFYNSDFSTVRGEMIEVPYTAGMRFEDAWNGGEIHPRIVGNKAVISLEIGPRDVGCIVALHK